MYRGRLAYDGKSFRVSDKFRAVFETMGRQKAVVDCIYAALKNGEKENKDVAAARE